MTIVQILHLHPPGKFKIYNITLVFLHVANLGTMKVISPLTTLGYEILF